MIGKSEGMVLGRVRGTCLHGILRSAKARVELLVPRENNFHSMQGTTNCDSTLDKFSHHLKNCGLDQEMLLGMIRSTQILHE